MNKQTAQQVLDRVDKAETILDNMANEFDLDQLPQSVNDIIEAAWKAAQEARRQAEKWVNSLS